MSKSVTPVFLADSVAALSAAASPSAATLAREAIALRSTPAHAIVRGGPPRMMAGIFTAYAIFRRSR